MITTLCTLSLLIGQVQPADLSRLASLETPKDVIVERAARRYRAWVYQTWHTQRDEFDRRWRAGETLVERWEKAGQPAEQRADVLEWFASASGFSSLGESSRDLPALPRFPSSGTSASELLTSQTDSSAISVETSGSRGSILVEPTAPVTEADLELQKLLDLSDLQTEGSDVTSDVATPRVPSPAEPSPARRLDLDAPPTPPVTDADLPKATQGDGSDDSLEKLLRDLGGPRDVDPKE